MSECERASERATERERERERERESWGQGVKETIGVQLSLPVLAGVVL